MFLEHLVYTLALALVLLSFSESGFQKIGALIIVVGGCAPDLDGLLDISQNKLILSNLTMVEHTRAIHNIAGLAIYMLVAGFVLARCFKIRFSTAACLSGVGFAAHILEDMLVYNPSSEVLWPLSSTEFGWGIISESRNLRFADSTVLLVGIALLISALLMNAAIAGYLPKATSD